MNRVQYVRLYAGSDGESHMQDLETELSAVNFAPPAPPLFLSPFASATQYALMGMPAGWSGDWHPTPKRQIIFYLKGEIEGEFSDGELRRFGPGSITLLEDTWGRGHRSRNVGTEEALLVVVQLPD